MKRLIQRYFVGIILFCLSFVYFSPAQAVTETKLTASDGAAADYFGMSVALSEDVMVIGAPYNDNPYNGNAGSAYIYRWDGSAWNEEAKLTASDGQAGDYFGYPVALSGNVIVAV